jgi:hypothetical protein
MGHLRYDLAGRGRPPIYPETENSSMDEQPTILCQFEMALGVSAVVWADFCTLREKWGDFCVNGFHYDCERYVREAIKTGDLVQALHWRCHEARHHLC